MLLSPFAPSMWKRSERAVRRARDERAASARLPVKRTRARAFGADRRVGAQCACANVASAAGRSGVRAHIENVHCKNMKKRRRD